MLPESGAKLSYGGSHLESEYPSFLVYEFEDIWTPSGKNSQLHIPLSFCILAIRTDDSKIMRQCLYRGEDCVENVIQTVELMADELQSRLKQVPPLTIHNAD